MKKIENILLGKCVPRLEVCVMSLSEDKEIHFMMDVPWLIAIICVTSLILGVYETSRYRYTYIIRPSASIDAFGTCGITSNLAITSTPQIAYHVQSQREHMYP